MASEIRVNKINSSSGVGTITLSPTGVDISGITTVSTLKVGTGVTASEDGDIFFTGIATATTFVGNLTGDPTGSGANLTALPAGQLTGTVADARISTLTASKLSGALPAISALNLTNVPAANVVGVHTSLNITGSTTTGTAVVGGGVTISESGIEASGIGITCANINGGQIGGRRNIVINGGMSISQRYGTTATTPTHTQYVVDRWENHLSQTGKFSVQQVEDAPNGEGVGKYSSKITSLSAYTIQSSDFFVYNYNIEGLNVDHLQFGTSSAKTITISFYVKSSLTGTFSLAIRNQAYNRSQVQEYSISSANTWERKSLTFTGDTSGTWLTTNMVGMRLSWGLGGGSSYHISSTGTWLGVDDWTTSSSTSVVSTNAATWYITGVQMEIGTQATPFEHLTSGEERLLCQRYYIKYVQQGCSGYIESAAGTTAQLTHNIPVSMRADPSTVCTTASNIGVERGGLYGINSTSGSLGWRYETDLSIGWAMDTAKGRWHTTWCRVQNVELDAEL